MELNDSEFSFQQSYSRLLGQLFLYETRVQHNKSPKRYIINNLRKYLSLQINDNSPFQKLSMNVEWLQLCWNDGVIFATNSLQCIVIYSPDFCPWTIENVLDKNFFPTILERNIVENSQRKNINGNS